MNDFEIINFSLPFVAPVAVHAFGEQKVLTNRELALVMLKLSDSSFALAEINPFYPFQQESLKECVDEVCHFLKRNSLEDRSAAFQALSGSSKTAIESLVFQTDLEGSVPFQKLIVPALPLQPEKLASLAAEIKKFDFKILKIKVGRHDLAEEIAWIHQLHLQLDPQIQFRLDGNRQLTHNQILLMANASFKERIQYFEEPTSTCLEDLTSGFFRQHGISIALDESTPVAHANFTPDDWENAVRLGLKAVVVRSNSLGGLNKALELFKVADRFSFLCVLSSSYEGPVGFLTMLRLAQRPFSCLQTLHGFDTFTCLNVDPFYAIIQNKCSFPKIQIMGNAIKAR